VCYTEERREVLTFARVRVCPSNSHKFPHPPIQLAIFRFVLLVHTMRVYYKHYYESGKVLPEKTECFEDMNQVTFEKKKFAQELQNKVYFKWRPRV
jgi:hypothetical protein